MSPKIPFLVSASVASALVFAFQGCATSSTANPTVDSGTGDEELEEIDPGEPDPTDEPGEEIGTPVLVDAGPKLDESCIGVVCDKAKKEVCSAGVCVLDTRDGDGDGVAAKDDCNDNDPKIFPGAKEVCNNKDDNCDKIIDEGFDKDMDGFYQCAHGSKIADCNDNDRYKSDPNNVAKPIENDEFATIDPHWKKAGNADINTPFAKWARVNQGLTAGSVGALWWNAEYTYDNFIMYVTMTANSFGPNGEGVSFAWVPGTDTTKVGAGGAGGYGVVGLGGYAVVIDTKQDPGEPVAPFVALIDGKTGTKLKTATLRSTFLSAFTNGAGTVRVMLEKGGKVSVALDKKDVLIHTIPGYVPFKGRWGFTGATGSLPSDKSGVSHYLSAISMIFPPGQGLGCVP